MNANHIALLAVWGIAATVGARHLLVTLVLRYHWETYAPQDMSVARVRRWYTHWQVW